MANQYTKKKEAQKKEIIWNLINSLLAGSLVFLGACTSSGLNWKGVGAGILAAAVVAVTKFYDYWKKEETEYCTTKLFSFVN
jgi:hypothetical protein